MPIKKRYKTSYPGVHFIEATTVGSTKKERIYYIRYRLNGKMIEEKAGRQYKDDMTPARASRIRSEKIEGDKPTNRDKRAIEQAIKQANNNFWTIDQLWDEYLKNNPDLKGKKTYRSQYKLYVGPEFGVKEPKDILALDVDRLRLRLSRSRSPQTVHHALSLMRRIVNFGVKKGLCSGLNFAIQMPAVNNEKTEDLTPEQLQNLLEAIEKDPHPQITFSPTSGTSIITSGQTPY